jgi:hypothetical protein
VQVDDWIRMHAHDITTLIICPPLIYGEAGDPGRQSVQIPMLTKAMVKCATATFSCCGSLLGMPDVTLFARICAPVNTLCRQRHMYSCVAQPCCAVLPRKQDSGADAACLRRTHKAACLGPGKAMWNCVHVRDLAHLYIHLMTAVLECLRDGGSEAVEKLRGTWFAEAGEFSWGELCKAIADALVAEGALDAYEELQDFSEEERREHMLGEVTWGVVACNARCTAERARELGWKATQPGLFECVPADVRRTIAAAKTS